MLGHRVRVSHSLPLAPACRVYRPEAAEPTMGPTCVLPVELHASIWEHSERAGHLQGGLHGAT